MKSLLYLFVLITTGFAFGQGISSPIGARANGMGYTSATLTDSWGIFNNIASIAEIKNTTAAFTYDVHPALTGANREAMAVVIPVKLGSFSTGIYKFGDEVYNEMVLSAGYGNRFGLASLGAQINYMQFRAEGFGRKGVWSLNVGGIAELTHQLSIGAYIVNLNQPALSETERLPVKLVAGLGFKPIEKVFVASEIEKDLDYSTNWRMGLEYKFHEKFCARTGYHTTPNTAYFGLGFKTAKFQIDYALQHNHSLSFGHQATVAYHFKK